MRNILVICCLLALLVTGCSKGEQEKNQDAARTMPSGAATAQAAVAPPPQHLGFSTVTPRQADQMIQTRKGLVMIDVRTPQELVNGFIVGSHNVPLWPVMKGQLNLPKDTPLLVICAVGGRSYAAGQALAKKWDFREVYSLSGGIDAWKQTGLPLSYNKK